MTFFVINEVMRGWAAIAAGRAGDGAKSHRFPMEEELHYASDSWVSRVELLVQFSGPHRNPKRQSVSEDRTHYLAYALTLRVTLGYSATSGFSKLYQYPSCDEGRYIRFSRHNSIRATS